MIVCGDLIMAKYRDLAPAKMEVNRLKEYWQTADFKNQNPVFQFMKDVK